MKILSKGNAFDDGSIIFDCKKCGCRFRMNPNEYHEDSYSYTSCTVYAYSSRRKFWANCPECYEMCSTSKDNQNITITGTAADQVTNDTVVVTC